jgi:hypothetical protein
MMAVSASPVQLAMGTTNDPENTKEIDIRVERDVAIAPKPLHFKPAF